MNLIKRVVLDDAIWTLLIHKFLIMIPMAVSHLVRATSVIVFMHIIGEMAAGVPYSHSNRMMFIHIYLELITQYECH